MQAPDTAPLQTPATHVTRPQPGPSSPRAFPVTTQSPPSYRVMGLGAPEKAQGKRLLAVEVKGTHTHTSGAESHSHSPFWKNVQKGLPVRGRQEEDKDPGSPQR